MADFTTTDDGWVFNLEDPEPPAVNTDTMELAPILGTAAQWENYSDPLLYSWEKRVRDWICQHAKNAQWARSAKNRRYTMRMVIEEITGEEYDQKKFAKDVPVLRKILEYYSTKTMNGSYINGKKYSKTVYCLSHRRVQKQRPFSLKLRLEQMAEEGLVPTPGTMKLPSEKMFCKPGQAKNPRTQATMDRRSAEGKARYNERYRDRAH